MPAHSQRTTTEDQAVQTQIASDELKIMVNEDRKIQFIGEEQTDTIDSQRNMPEAVVDQVVKPETEAVAEVKASAPAE